MLTARNITYTAGDKKLLDDVSVEFEAGKLNIIIGPNGAGKSTLVKILCNELAARSGIICYGDRNVRTMSLAEQARMRAVLSQNIELAFPLKVKEVVMMGRYPHFAEQPARRDKEAAEEAMRYFDILDMGERDYMTLSGGEKQRVHFARVTAQVWYPGTNGCRYLLLDEPLTFLDVRYQFGFMHKIRALLQQADMVVVGVVHDLNLAAKFADHIVLLHQGKVLAMGGKSEVLTPDNIRMAYALEPVIHHNANGMYLFFK